MKNKNEWTPTKYILKAGKYTFNNDPRFVGVGSRFIVGILAECHTRLLKDHATGLLLDLGCGYVPCYEMYKEYIDDNVCVDWENTLHKNPYIDYWLDLGKELPLESGQFDTILCSDVLEHIANPQLIMSEASRLLKSGGKLILTVPFFYWLHEEPYDFYRYTRHSLQKFCDECELKVVELEPYGGALEIILDVIAKNTKDRYAGFHLSASNYLIKTRYGRGYSRRKWGKFPLGYYLVAQK